MRSSIFIASCLAAVAAASPAIVRRGDPEDPTGNAQVYFSCDGQTYPNPGGAGGAGEGGTGISSTSMSLHLPDGTVLTGSDATCQQDSAVGVSSLLQLCSWRNDQLDGGGLLVHVSYSDIGGECSMNFGYRGVSYSVDNARGPTTSKCGWSSGGFMPFSSSLSDVCYFDV